MWNMMCDVMPTISEDGISQQGPGGGMGVGEDANMEQLMIQMLDERDKLVESLRENQERLQDMEMKLTDVEKERDSLQRQIAASLPQVSFYLFFFQTEFRNAFSAYLLLATSNLIYFDHHMAVPG